MATRFRLTNDDTDPAVTPAHQTYTHTRTGTPEYRRLLTSDASVLTTTAYTPDAADDLAAGDALHSTFVSDPMPAGVQFNSGQTIKMAIQGLEANAANNLSWQMWVGIYDSSGTTLQRTVRSKVSEGLEFGGALAARFLSTTQDGANYTTVANDRLVVEVSVTGTPTAAGGTQGHNASLRFGGDGASGDLPETDGSTSTTVNPWIEFTPTITFGQTISVGQATETDTGHVLSPVRIRGTTQGSETDLAQPVGRLKVAAISQANETDIPMGLTAGRRITLGLAGEASEAFIISAVGAIGVGQAVEVDEAQRILIPIRLGVGQALETDEAHLTVIPKLVTVDQATETDQSQGIGAVINPGSGVVRSPNRVRVYASHNEVT